MESQEGHNPALEWRGKSASIPYGIRTELIAAAISHIEMAVCEIPVNIRGCPHPQIVLDMQ